ncbi:hypothetical protein [Streptomyces benahoarensis]|uniref:Integral membrane protein n=1 Tax=Streptomyces benahoarensis TaxID=2595054 RepID=A0A553ZEL9_9ACTN|nr:hypothetical protein [Streptomyces benahoarensis]TSB21305.1 hypothetical protein FNJ62_19185 [Streptomyces benahoarensis]TSB39901.1 hypothetical protein FNZ23_14785 [Streptomyces benahoarensis]
MRTDYVGAVYGSILAASVVATAGTLGPFPRIKLMLLLLITGVVFWAAHVYARLAGERLLCHPVTWGEVRRVAAREWPIVKVAVPPAAAVAISSPFGLGMAGTTWCALIVALIEQVGWATVPVVRGGATVRVVLVNGAVNLLLGAVIVLAKVVLEH